jgi:hypothetical protein
MIHPIRILLTIFLLVEVWQHSHWSVALGLSLLIITKELEFWVICARGCLTETERGRTQFIEQLKAAAIKNRHKE